MVNAECIKNHSEELISMLGMDKDLTTKHLDPSTATAKGHMVTFEIDTLNIQQPTGYPRRTNER